MTGDSPSLGEVLHRARQASTDGRDRPWPVEDWEDRDPRLQAIDEAMAAAVAARAVADAERENTRKAAQLFALSVHLPAILDALEFKIGWMETEAQAKPYRAALEALGGREGQERSDDKEAES